MRDRLFALLFALVSGSWVGATHQAAPRVAQLLDRLAAETTHFATDDIVRNRWTERRWPAGLLEQQQHLLDELRAASVERDALQALLAHVDPRVRTLALAALFIREEPRDLPLIASMRGDNAATFPRLRTSIDSRGGRMPLAYFESSQTVGDVAQAMVRFYLEAAFEEPTAPFEKYWAERGSRARSVSWFLARMRRASRETSPLQPQYEADVRRVMTGIDALPAMERGWTLLYVRAGSYVQEELVPDAVIVEGLRVVGPDALMRFLRRQPPTDDPDLFPDMGGGRRATQSHLMMRFILAHARDLLRPADADAVLAGAKTDLVDGYGIMWIAASAHLRGLEDVEKAATSLKADIQRISPRETLGPDYQGSLAFALWQMRGAAERPFLTEWFYTAMPFVGSTDSGALAVFLQKIDHEARPDTPALLASIVGDPRFEEAPWAVLAQLLRMGNKALTSPLVETRIIYDHRPPSNRPNQQETLAAWRTLLRQHFGSPR